MQSEENAPNFVIKKTLTGPEAISLLLENFPWLPSALGEELELDEPYYAYDRFADEILRRVQDDAFLQTACDFISRLAETRDSFLTDILGTTVLETAAYNPDLALRMKKRLGPTAKDILQSVERHLLGR